MRKLHVAVVFAALLVATPAFAARCGGDFNAFLSQMSADAQGAGVSQATISQAFSGLTVDGGVLAFDRRQRYTFNKTFEQYVSTRVGPGRINGARAMLQRHAALLSQIEQKYGVPRQILVAIWGLESDFGKGDMGKLAVVRTLATLAHDCRRSDLFQGELLAALKMPRSAKRNSCRLPTSNTGLISTAMAASICVTASPTCSPPPRTCCIP